LAKTTYIGGWHAVFAALEADEAPVEIILASGRADARATKLRALAQARNVPIQSRSRSDLDWMAPGLRHQGVLASVGVRQLDGDDLLMQPAPPEGLILVLDGVQDPHNLGACLRTAEASGVDLVVIPRDRAAEVTPVVRKVAAGSAERVPVVAVTNLARTLRQLKDLGWWLTGLAGEATDSLHDVDFRGPTVIILGSEGQGMRRLTRECCDRLIRIPMHGQVESLNVSVAAAVCLYEAVRQRIAPNRGRP
jgi:23S rRNA (guanosine2251-2'-O)-methyltransferase